MRYKTLFGMNSRRSNMRQALIRNAAAGQVSTSSMVILPLVEEVLTSVQFSARICGVPCNVKALWNRPSQEELGPRKKRKVMEKKGLETVVESLTAEDDAP